MSSTATGTLANTASVAVPAGTTDPTPTNNSATDTDTFTPQADLQITNTDGQTTVVPGTAVTYTIVVTNAGPSSVTGATVTDTLPATLTGATYTATATGGATGFPASGTRQYQQHRNHARRAARSPTSSWHLQSAAATGTLANTASVAAPAGSTDPNAANNSATDTDTLAPQADLQITNTDGQTSRRAGRGGHLYDRGHQRRPEQRDRRHGHRHAAGHAHRRDYTATATGGATGFTASGTGNINNTVTMPTGSTITYIVSGTIELRRHRHAGQHGHALPLRPAPPIRTRPTTPPPTPTRSTPQADLQITEHRRPDDVPRRARRSPIRSWSPMPARAT